MPKKIDPALRTMVLEPFQLLIPIGRFGSLIWLVAVGFLLPTTRRAAGGPARMTS